MVVGPSPASGKVLNKTDSTWDATYSKNIPKPPNQNTKITNNILSKASFEEPDWLISEKSSITAKA